MEERDRKKYHQKGTCQTTIKMVYGKMGYCRTIYEVMEKDSLKYYVHLLDETLQLNSVGLISTNMAGLLVRGITELSYQECAPKVSEVTKQTVSAMEIWKKSVKKRHSL